MKQVSLTKTIGSEILTVEGFGSVPKEDALQIAAHIVFLVAGDLSECMENGRITRWNMNSRFFNEYRKIMEAPSVS